VKKAWTIVVSLFVGLLAIFLGKRSSSKKQKSQSPPENTAAKAANESVQETFEEQVDRIKSATTGDSPADDLADLGNGRRR
tara:strand:+ start:776 stop:1018 length:243 start_codon:yes stop_codon:yes gene_type:complete